MGTPHTLGSMETPANTGFIDSTSIMSFVYFTFCDVLYGKTNATHD